MHAEGETVTEKKASMGTIVGLSLAVVFIIVAGLVALAWVRHNDYGLGQYYAIRKEYAKSYTMRTSLVGMHIDEVVRILGPPDQVGSTRAMFRVPNGQPEITRIIGDLGTYEMSVFLNGQGCVTDVTTNS